MDNIAAALEAAGGQLSDVVQLTSYVTDFSRLSELRALRDARFPTEPPASTTVQVTALADPAAMIEVGALAVIRRARPG